MLLKRSKLVRKKTTLPESDRSFRGHQPKDARRRTKDDERMTTDDERRTTDDGRRLRAAVANTPAADGVLTPFSVRVGSATIMNMSHVKSELALVWTVQSIAHIDNTARRTTTSLTGPKPIKPKPLKLFLLKTTHKIWDSKLNGTFSSCNFAGARNLQL